MLTVELHRHFEAGMRPETIAALARKNHVTEVRTRSGQLAEGVDPQNPDSIRAYYESIASGFTTAGGFARFVDSFGLPLSVFRSLEDLERGVFDQLVECADAGSLHTELRGSPFTYRETVAASLEEITAALMRGVDRAWNERQVSGTFVLSFSRQKGLGAPELPEKERQAPIIARIAAEFHRPARPLGLDLAGFPETTFPPRAFEAAFAPAVEAGVPITVHAGEQASPPDFADASPDLIVEAVEKLGARRIGHGTSLAASAEVRAMLRERRVAVECCPVSNEKMGFVPVAEHPLPLLVREGLLVSISTDDPLMFGPFTVRDTFDCIAGPLRLDERHLAQMTRNGIESAFVSEERRQWLRGVVSSRTSD